MKPKFQYPSGATPLIPDELAQLIPEITTQGELNELEKANIKMAKRKALRSSRLKKDLLSYSGLFSLHRMMFEEVWQWAGKPRNTEKNIGIAPHDILQKVGELCLDVNGWIEFKTYSLQEIAIRFHHRLVYIHPFVNGNGRHARLVADLLLHFHGLPELDWGHSSLLADDAQRKQYIQALRLADTKADYHLLYEFAVGSPKI